MNAPKPVGTVVILRGIPGSGKSTFGKYLVGPGGFEANIVSNDDYFMTMNTTTGEIEYKYDREKMNDAVAQCMRRFINLLTGPKPGMIVVDNTNTRFWEFAGYMNAARAFDYTVQIKQVFAPVELCVARQTDRGNKAVPKERIEQMANRFENIKLYGYREEIVNGY